MADGDLPSWNESPARAAALDFVARVTVEGSPDFLAVPERIGTSPFRMSFQTLRNNGLRRDRSRRSR
jgi:hypothetical protein